MEIRAEMITTMITNIILVEIETITIEMATADITTETAQQEEAAIKETQEPTTHGLTEIICETADTAV